MPTVRVALDGTDAPVAQSDSWMPLQRKQVLDGPKRKREYKLLRRQEEDDAESEGSGDEEDALTGAQQRLQESSPFSDFELPTVPDLGALPMPRLNTRRSMQLDKIKRRPRRSLSRRQFPPPPPPSPKFQKPPPPKLLKPPSTELLSSESGESDGISSESEDEASTSSASSTSTSSSSATITSSPFPTDPSPDLRQSTFIAAANPTDSPSALPTDGTATVAPQQQAGPPPETKTTMIVGVTILGVAIVIAFIFLLFRYCLPVRNWHAALLQKHRDEKAARLGTAPSPWKWPIHFIFGSDRPAPPRREQQQAQYYYNNNPPTSYASNCDLESPSAPGLVADGFRPLQNTASPHHPPEYKSYTTASNANSWVANGWRAPLSQISQRLSNWPRRSGTARWFFGGGVSRWSDSDASESSPRTTYSESQIVDMYGAPTPRSVAPPTRRTGGSLSKSPQIEVSQREVAANSPPLPLYQKTPSTAAVSPTASSPTIVKTTIIKPPPPAAAAAAQTGLGLSQTPIRPRASPRVSYLRSSVATTATSGSRNTMAQPLPPLPFTGFSHFSVSTVDPGTPRRFVSEGLPAGVKPRSSGMGRFPVRSASVGSVSSVSSASSRASVGGMDKPLPKIVRVAGG